MYQEAPLFLHVITVFQEMEQLLNYIWVCLDAIVTMDIGDQVFELEKRMQALSQVEIHIDVTNKGSRYNGNIIPPNGFEAFKVPNLFPIGKPVQFIDQRR